MTRTILRPLVLLPCVLMLPFGCEVLSNRLTKWQMLDQAAVENPIQAVGGDGIVFSPKDARPLTRQSLVTAKPQDLVVHYAPVFIQQRVDTKAQMHPYPPEYDQIGNAQMQHDNKGQLKAFVAGQPVVYAIYQQVPISGKSHTQLTYTAWYPAHPRMKAIDLEEADIDSCVLRITLDAQNVPILFETIAACGCFHKVFVERWIEQSAGKSFGGNESGKKFAVERSVKGDIDWEVAGVVDDNRSDPGRPVVFIKAGDHKVLGIGSTTRLKVPPGADVKQYALTDYADLYQLPVAGSNEKAPFFDTGGKVRGAERKERFIFGILGVDGAGQPRSNDQIKLHFDQSTWSDPTIYERFLRLPPGTL